MKWKISYFSSRMKQKTAYPSYTIGGQAPVTGVNPPRLVDKLKLPPPPLESKLVKILVCKEIKFKVQTFLIFFIILGFYLQSAITQSNRSRIVGWIITFNRTFKKCEANKVKITKSHEKNERVTAFTILLKLYRWITTLENDVRPRLCVQP